MIIGLNGEMGSGKDTAWEFIEQWARGEGRIARRDAFADRLKESAARAFGLPLSREAAVDWCNTFKLEGTVDIRTGSSWFTITGREFLQFYGTEAHRQVFDTDFWIDACLPITTSPSDEILVLTDVRFDNEAQRIHDVGGVVWKVVRPRPETETDKHASEQPLLPSLVDVTILNNSTLDDYRTQVVAQIEREACAA